MIPLKFLSVIKEEDLFSTLSKIILSPHHMTTLLIGIMIMYSEKIDLKTVFDAALPNDEYTLNYSDDLVKVKIEESGVEFNIVFEGSEIQEEFNKIMKHSDFVTLGEGFLNFILFDSKNYVKDKLLSRVQLVVEFTKNINPLAFY